MFSNKIKISMAITGLIMYSVSLSTNAGLLHIRKSSDTQPGPVGSLASNTGVAAPSSDIVAADQRVDNARTQLEVAKKQLSAAKALVKAAQAEFTAAQADRQALALKTTAQGLADSAGLGAATGSTYASVPPHLAPAVPNSAVQAPSDSGANPVAPEFSNNSTQPSSAAPASNIPGDPDSATLR